MWKSTTVRMNDYDAVVMGVLEPILVLSVMAVIAFLVRLFWVVPTVMTLNSRASAIVCRDVLRIDLSARF
jgi:hypothetical protein